MTVKNVKEGSYSEILRIAYPLILNAASITIMQFVDKMFLSWYSPSSIAAGGASALITFTIVCFFLGVAGYTNTLVSQYYGAKNYKECSKSTWQGILFCVLTYPLIILVFIPIGPYIFKMAGHTPEIIELEVIYYRVVLYGECFIPLNTAISSFFNGRGLTKIPMIANIVGNIVNVFLNYVLIFGNLGFPEMGILGAGIGTVVGCAVSVLILFCFFLSKKNRIDYLTAKTFGFSFNLFKKLLKYGVPAGVQFFLDIIAFSIFIMLIGRLGEIELAVSNIILSLDILVFMPIVGLGIANSTLVGQYIGRKRHDISKSVTFKSLIIGLIYAFFIGIILIVFPKQTFEIFRSENYTLEKFMQMLVYGRPILKILFFFILFDTISIVFNYALKGAGDTHFTMWTQIIISWVIFIPGTLVSILVFKSIVFAWIFGSIYLFFVAIIFFFRFLSGKWKEIKMIEPLTPKISPVDMRVYD